MPRSQTGPSQERIIQFSLMTAYENVATDVKVIFLATFRVWSDLRTWPKVPWRSRLISSSCLWNWWRRQSVRYNADIDTPDHPSASLCLLKGTASVSPLMKPLTYCFSCLWEHTAVPLGLEQGSSLVLKAHQTRDLLFFMQWLWADSWRPSMYLVQEKLIRRHSDADGWCGVSISVFYRTDCLFHQFQRQEEDINLLLQGTLGQVLRSDHTRKVARKVTLTSCTMSSCTVMSENWMILSWDGPV
ncbi:hypothetical protein SKAU_G00152100 [Synaphobranchus kaupii]|uniref:Uncharacterized protein n=1 Tax=Synaphobranchus kaupii TaxID=118154 RepID=A0A9Q1FHD5_SYNKA|nr:hypothetical protein SKAU_G00152100 [Synaphobranchus kaupii]